MGGLNILNAGIILKIKKHKFLILLIVFFIVILCDIYKIYYENEHTSLYLFESTDKDSADHVMRVLDEFGVKNKLVKKKDFMFVYVKRKDIWQAEYYVGMDYMNGLLNDYKELDE